MLSKHGMLFRIHSSTLLQRSQTGTCGGMCKRSLISLKSAHKRQYIKLWVSSCSFWYSTAWMHTYILYTIIDALFFIFFFFLLHCIWCWYLKFKTLCHSSMLLICDLLSKMKLHLLLENNFLLFHLLLSQIIIFCTFYFSFGLRAFWIFFFPVQIKWGLGIIMPIHSNQIEV